MYLQLSNNICQGSIYETSCFITYKPKKVIINDEKDFIINIQISIYTYDAVISINVPPWLWLGNRWLSLMQSGCYGLRGSHGREIIGISTTATIGLV